MKVEITRVGGAPVKFSEFAERHELVIEVHERNLTTMYAMRMPDSSRYYAHFKRGEIRSGRCGLLGVSGDGSTPEEAVREYANELRGQLLIVNAFTDERREIQCPNEWEPE